MSARLFDLYKKDVKKQLMDTFKYKSSMEIPKIEKVVLNIGMGDAHANSKRLASTMDELAAITGQKPVKTVAKKSIANFKIRDGYDVGCKVTLRGDTMYEFLDRLINFSLPRVRDFKGISPKSFDNFGNYNFSVKEQIIFPEIDFDKAEYIYGINITVVTTGKSKEEAKALLDGFGMPFWE
ncbi:MAG: 50S ribosomal protein L5 [Spirochaetes bacterium]|nr:50S ribosomal protein L5 [Spirochaetota bacterium]MBN2769134.1 50S ribosomal protein L5 [Spirochaetota bacterium]HRX15360.1 50S ribosomal protein L5 [Spirochaetota bacterium]